MVEMVSEQTQGMAEMVSEQTQGMAEVVLPVSFLCPATPQHKTPTTV
jgi:hypothetical protein